MPDMTNATGWESPQPTSDTEVDRGESLPWMLSCDDDAEDEYKKHGDDSEPLIAAALGVSVGDDMDEDDIAFPEVTK